MVPVAAPWATDSKGASVATHYTIQGDKLVQVIEPSASTAYPVVADPSWMWHSLGWGMKLTRDETRQSSNYAMACAMCVAFLKRAPTVGVACGVYAGYIAAQAAIANGERPQTCLFFDAVPAPGSIWRISCK